MSNNDQNSEPMSVEELASLASQGVVTVIDVRSRAEFEGGHVTGAKNIPLDDLMTETEGLPSGQHVVTVCGRGGQRSVEAAERLRTLGISARPLCGGFAAWSGSQTPAKQEGQP
jgi:rhodanese-related sulfurtransferase